MMDLLATLHPFVARCCAPHSLACCWGNVNDQLQINFNMSFLDLPCEYLTVDALDILGSNRVNITGSTYEYKLLILVSILATGTLLS